MITVHHLENSRSQRVLWMLEELGLPYGIKRYERNKATMLAPPELKAVHPLGKSPVIEHDGRVIAETGAIAEYLVELADGRLVLAHAGGGGLLDDPLWLCRGIVVVGGRLLLLRGSGGRVGLPTTHSFSPFSIRRKAPAKERRR